MRDVLSKLAVAVLVSVLGVTFAAAPNAHALPGPVEVADVNNAGAAGNGSSVHAALSDDGRFVAFRSNADNLVSGDTNGVVDVFVRDRQSGTTERVDLTSTGDEVRPPRDQFSFAGDNPAISADGNVVAFEAPVALVPGAPPGDQVYVRDRRAGTTELVSGDQPSGNNFYAAISADGNAVVFESQRAEGDNLFLHDRRAGTTVQVDITSDGSPSAGPLPGCCVARASVSTDGRYVSFTSLATDLVPGDGNGDWDVFVRDLVAGTTERMSVDSAGNEGNHRSAAPSISADGSQVTFVSTSTNLGGSAPFARPRVFVRDRLTRMTTLESTNAGVGDGGGDPHLSANGRYLAFRDDDQQIWLRDRQSATTTRATPSGSDSDLLALSGDGTRIAYSDNTHVYSLPSPDTTRPRVDLVTPAQGSFYVRDQAVNVSFACSDESGGSALSSCQGTVSSGGALDTSTDGNHAFSVTATDGAGNTATVTHTYTVVEAESASASLPSGGGVVTTDSGGTGPTGSDPVETTVRSPNAGTVSIGEGAVTQPRPDGFTLLGLQMQITAPPATPEAPLSLMFDLDAAILTPGATKDVIELFKDGVPLPDCLGATTVPNGVTACISSRADAPSGGGDIRLTVLSTSASAWNIAVPHAPVADAGPDLTVKYNAGFLLDSSGSRDLDGDPLRYHWTQMSGPAAVIRDDGETTPGAQVDGVKGPATLKFRVTVTDSSGRSSADDVLVTVKPK